MDIKRLRYAIALAEELNFARAADKLHLSQPALSRSIQTLEDELGLLLFDRDNRNVRLTTVGAVFLAQARPLLFQMRSLERDMGLIRDGAIGQVAFGVGPLPTASILPQLIRALRQQRPELRLAVASNNWRYLLLHLRAEEIEFFVADTRAITPAADLTISPLCRQYGSFMCRPGHPLLAKATRQPSDLLPYGFVSLLMPDAFKLALRAVLGLAPHAPVPVLLECDNLFVLKQMVQEDDAILMSTEAGSADEVAAGTLRPLPFADMPPMYAEIGVVALAGRSLSPGAQLVLDHLRTVAMHTPATAVFHDGAYGPVS